jgi:hypothetical protein
MDVNYWKFVQAFLRLDEKWDSAELSGQSTEAEEGRNTFCLHKNCLET